MQRTPYGTVEFYSEMFSDILADVDLESSPTSADNILKGFYHALESWIDYHDTQCRAYCDLRDKAIEALGD